MKRRLRYTTRVLKQKPDALIALLNLKGASWTQLVLDDLHMLRKRVCPNMPEPLSDPAAWRFLIVSAEWNECVDHLFFTESVLDCVADAPSDLTSHSIGSHTFVCGDCGMIFPSEKALGAHHRVKHGTRNVVHNYLFSGLCPVCGTDFKSRSRCSAHLSDKRRPKCREQLLSGGYPVVPAELRVQLDEQDRADRLAARRVGRTHAIAHQCAVRADGRIAGRLVSAPPRPRA